MNGYIGSYLKNLALLIQPLIDQYNKGEYNADIIIKTNKLASKKFNSKKFFQYPYFHILDMLAIGKLLFML